MFEVVFTIVLILCFGVPLFIPKFPLPAIIAALHDIGYDGPITIEQEDPVCPGYEGVAVAGEYLREIIEQPTG